MKIALLILLLPLVILLAQDEKSSNPNVELPDFVITGTDEISIKRAEKLGPEFISTITEEFIKPVYSSYELGLRQLSNPIKENLDLLESGSYSRGSLFGEAGIYVTPKAGFSYTYPFDNGILSAGFGGLLQRAYIENSDRYSLNGRASIDYTIGVNDNGTSGTRFLLRGDYNSLSYKLFSSADPTAKQMRNEGNYFLGVKNTSGKTFIFDLNVEDNFTSLVQDNFTENLINANGFAKIQVSDISLGVKAKYQKQFLDTDSLDNEDYNYLFARPVVSFELLNSIKVGVGYTFSKLGDEKFNDIYASVGLKIYKDMILLGEYNPGAEFITSGSLLRKNEYFNPISVTNLFLRKSNSLKVSVKYEYEKYYQVDAGVKYFKSGNYPYYMSSIPAGRFELATADAESYEAYVNLLFHFGPYGFLFGSFNYSRIRDNNSNTIPYHPRIMGNATYGYELTRNLLGEIMFDFYYKAYTDISNLIELNSFVDLGVKFTYKLQETFIISLEMSNILNRKIYYWQGYEEKPFDLLAGFNLLFD